MLFKKIDNLNLYLFHVIVTLEATNEDTVIQTISQTILNILIDYIKFKSKIK